MGLTQSKSLNARAATASPRLTPSRPSTPTITVETPPSKGAQDKRFSAFSVRTRSVVYGTKGIVSTTSPLATEAGLAILRSGGNAADAAVAVAAVLNVVDPAMTGIGGDMFCLHYEARTSKVQGLNGSGRSPAGATLEDLIGKLGVTNPKTGQIPTQSVHGITIPGAAKGWVDTVQRFGSGRLALYQILEPAIKMADDGVPISKIAAHFWAATEQNLLNRSSNGWEVLKKDPKSPSGYRAPREGELFKNPTLAETFRQLAEKGAEGFYKGAIGETVISTLQSEGGYHTMDDMQYHVNEDDGSLTPLFIRLLDERQRPPIEVDLWEHAPNSQGVVALMALGVIRELEKAGRIVPIAQQDHNSASYLHIIIECLRIAFADAVWYISDPECSDIDFKKLLTEEYLSQRAKLFDPKKATIDLKHGSPAYNVSDTVYLAVVDEEGNACSFINSVCDKFGSCIIPPGTGFALQNRGTGFRLDSTHPNAYAPLKRPYHTIIPAILTNADGSLHTVFGVMGGAMQPQGHVQMLLNILKFGFDPQEALDVPRICVSVALPGKQLETGRSKPQTVFLEEGIGEDIADELQKMGHRTEIVTGFARSMFGRGQVISVNHDPVTGQKVYCAASDGRGDGAAAPL